MKTTRSRILIQLGVAALYLSPHALAQAPQLRDSLRVGKAMSQKPVERLDWWQIDQEVTARLSKNSSTQVLIELKKAPPAAVKDQLMLLNLAGRFAMKNELTSAVSALSKQTSDVLPDYLVASAADFLIGKKQFQSAIKLLEAFPKAEPGWGYVLIENWSKQSKQSLAKEIDAWLVRQQDKANSNYWIRERVRFREKQGTCIELLNEMKAQVAAHPDDNVLASRMVEASSQISVTKFSLDWIGTIVKLRTAYQSYRLAESLSGRSPRAAIGLLERSLSLPYTADDRKEIEQFMLRYSARAFQPQEQNLEKELRAWTKEALARAYQADGQAKKAQPLMVELAKAYPGGVPPHGFSQFAGQVQAATQTSFVEQSIKKAEPENEDSAKYWLSRLDYYIGRGDMKSATEAFDKVLKIASDKNDEGAYNRSQAVNCYCRFLQKGAKNDDKSAVMNLLWREFDKTPPGGAYSVRIVHEMLFYDNDTSHLLSCKNERLWAYLKGKESLDWNDRQVLIHMAYTVAAGGEKAFIDSLNSLLSKKGARSCATVGSALLCCHNDYRVTKQLASMAAMTAIAPLKRAYAEESDEYQKGIAQSDLFSAYIATNNWRSAEPLSLPKNAATGTIINHLERLSLAAACSGAFDQSLTYWKRKDQIDPSNLTYLDDLAKHGMKDRLKKYYQDLNTRSKSSQVYQDAIAKLDSIKS